MLNTNFDMSNESLLLPLVVYFNIVKVVVERLLSFLSLPYLIDAILDKDLLYIRLVFLVN